jgi:hypothetical protein
MACKRFVGSIPIASTPETATILPVKRLALLVLLPIALAGCGNVSNTGSSSVPTDLSADCQQTYNTVSAIENNAGKLSNSEWNDTVASLSGQWAGLRQQIISVGVPPSDKVSVAYSDLAGEFGKC